ncbi:MAG: carboxypeptidase regulatory-like domain-containing protein [Thermoplasmatales archaeon]|nr:carboxypeptidase regulatory-like domain-containing protein [Thermoplasmatales archaeon]
MRGKGAILLSLLFIISAVLIVPSAESSNVKAESAPMPTWNVGDMWNYTASLDNGDITGDVSIKIASTETVTTDTDYNVYNTTMHFTYEGTVEGIAFTGIMDGITYYSISTLAVVKEIYTINNDYGIYGTYYNRTITTYNPPKDYNQFPITVGEEWNVNVNAHMEWHATEGDGESDSAIVENYECLRTDSVWVAAGTYNVFVINSTTEKGSETAYYSSDVCNFVKSEMYDENGALTTEMDLVSYCIGVTPTRSVSGTVKDENGDPISGATVTADGHSDTTDANGNYTISNLSPDTYTVTASKSGYTSSYQIVNLTTFSANIDFTLNATPTTGTITGHVYVSGTTTGIQNANVSINANCYTLTDANGAYTLSGVAQGTHTVTASAAGYASSSAEVSVTAGQTSFHNFTLTLLSETGNISGRVTADGTGLNNATVTVEGAGLTAQTNITGHYTVTGVPPGTYNVTASKSGYVSSTQTNVAVTAGNTTELNFTLTVSAEQQRGSISGTVKDKNGNPVSGATVKAYNASDMVAGTAYTNSTGGYTLSNLLPGTYTIKVSKTGFQEYSMSVTLGANQTLTSKDATLTSETAGGEGEGAEGGAGIADYWWAAIMIAVIIVVVLFVLRRRMPAGRRIPAPREEIPAREEVAPKKPVEKRFCIKCGREISKTASFCPYCGYRFKK